MTRDENLERLRAATSGRVAVSVQALPYVFLAPIHLVERGDDSPTVIVTVDPTTAHTDALRDVVVAVHTDGTDPSGARWQILVQGLSTILDPAAIDPTELDAGKQACIGAEVIRGWRTFGP